MTLFDAPPKIGAMLPYFGGKRTMAPMIVNVIGPHRTYFEPFCGSLAVLLAKKPCSLEVANDLHGDVINLARVLADENLSVTLYARLTRTLCSEDVFRDAAEAWKEREDRAAPDAADIDRAYEFFVCSWLGMNGVAGTRANNHNFAARYTSNGGSPGTRFVAAVDSIPPWHYRMRAVTFLSKDGIEICEKIEDKDGTVIYADPPYLVKGASYLHDFVDDDHERLAAALSRFKLTRVVVSYYDHPQLAQLYPTFNKISCTQTKSLVSQGKRSEKGRTDAPEVLLVNFAVPSIAV